MYIRLTQGRYAGDVRDVAITAARAMLADGRAEMPAVPTPQARPFASGHAFSEEEVYLPAQPQVIEVKAGALPEAQAPEAKLDEPSPKAGKTSVFRRRGRKP